MALSISERQRRTPGPAEDRPAFDTARLAQALDVRHEVRSRVGRGLAGGRRAARTTLVEDDDAPGRRIEEAPMDRPRAAARSAMQKQHWQSIRVAALFPVQLV